MARKAGKFSKEIVPINVPPARKGDQPEVFDSDEFPRPATTLASLAKLRPAFASVF